MARTLLWGSAVRVHDSQAYKKTGVTRERISCIILQNTVKGGRRQGRQRKRWEDNIREWTGPEFAKSPRAVENREKWRKLVVKSSVVPKRTSRSRDR